MKQKIIALIVLSIMCTVAQPVQAQKWLETVDKGLSAAEKLFGSKKKSKKNDSKGTSDANKSGINKFHTTENTKVYYIDGGVSELNHFSEGRAYVRTDKGARFVINTKGEKVFDIPAGYAVYISSFDEAPYNEGCFNSGRLMTYSPKAKTAIIYDVDGNIVKKMTGLEGVSGFSDSVAVICRKMRKGKDWYDRTYWDYIDVNGRIISETMDVYQGDGHDFNVRPASEGLVPMYNKESDRWGYRDKKCNWVIKPQFLGVNYFHDGLAVAHDAATEKWGYIDRTGKWVIQPQYTKKPENFYAGLAKIFDKEMNQYFINKSGSIVMTIPENIKISSFSYNGYAVWNGGNDPWTNEVYLIDTSFKKLFRLPQDNSSVSYYDDDFCILSPNPGCYSPYYICDYNGNLLLGYHSGKDNFIGGMGIVENGSDKSGEKYSGYFNSDGEMIVMFKDTKF